mgnify:CR=1 FL=1
MGTYILASLLFVFAAMAEFALVIFIKQNSEWRKDGRMGMELEKEIQITEKPSINVVAPVDGLGSSMKDTEYVVPKARHSYFLIYVQQFKKQNSLNFMYKKPAKIW